MIEALRPPLVINCAAYTAVDLAESEEELARCVNGHAVGELAIVCRDLGARFVSYSTDYVFDGTKDGEYVESDEPMPINAYGRSKLVGEELALGNYPESLVIRTSWVLSGTHRNFASTMLEKIAKGQIRVVDDQIGRPTIAGDLATATLQAVRARASGLLHITNGGATSWYGLARKIAKLGGLDVERVHPCSSADYPTPAPRPSNSVLGSERLEVLGMQPLRSFSAALPGVVASQMNGRLNRSGPIGDCSA